MSEYKYRALKDNGEEVTGTIEAVDKKAAISSLRRQGLFPTSVRPLSGREPADEPKINKEQLMMILDAQHKSRNIFTIFKNYLRRKILRDMLNKQQEDK